MHNYQAFCYGVMLYCHTTIDNRRVLPHPQFVAYTFSVMLDLRRDAQQTSLIDVGWGYSAIRRALNKVYVEKSWKSEQLDDVLHTVLVQRPQLKTFVTKVLANDYRDEKASRKWQKFNCGYHIQTRISSYVHLY